MTAMDETLKKQVVEYLCINYSGILEFEQGGSIYKLNGETPYTMQFEDRDGYETEYEERSTTRLAILDGWDVVETLDLISGKLSHIIKVIENYFGPGHISWVDFKNNNYKILTKEEVSEVIEMLFKKYKVKKSFHRGKYDYILTTGNDKKTDFVVTYSRCGREGSSMDTLITNRYCGVNPPTFSKRALTEEIFNYFKVLGIEEITGKEISYLLFKDNIYYV